MNLIKRNLVWLLFAQTATWVVSISLLLVAPRVLGDRTFGQLSFVIVFVSFFELVATMGTNTFVVKSVARDADGLGRYVLNAVVMKLCLALVFAGLALAVGGFPGIVAHDASPDRRLQRRDGDQLRGHDHRSGAHRPTAHGGSGEVEHHPVLRRRNRGRADSPRPRFGDRVRNHLQSGVPDPNTVQHSQTLANLAGNRKIEPRLWPAIIKGGFPFFILAGLLVVYGTIDVPLLQAMSGSEEVGWYSLAYRWVSVPAFFAASVATAFFPALSAEGVALAPAFSSLANRAARIALLVATPAAVGIALVASPFLTLLYGAEFQRSVPLLQILAIHIPIVSLDIVLGSVVMAADRQRQWVVISVIATIVNPLLNLVAIPQSQRLFDNGAIGAAVVTVLTEVILLVGAISLRPKAFSIGPRSTVCCASCSPVAP